MIIHADSFTGQFTPSDKQHKHSRAHIHKDTHVQANTHSFRFIKIHFAVIVKMSNFLSAKFALLGHYDDDPINSSVSKPSANPSLSANTAAIKPEIATHPVLSEYENRTPEKSFWIVMNSEKMEMIVHICHICFAVFK